jgi:Putative zinc-finger
MELNDELLCAYIDGELDPQRRAQIERALEQDAGGRLRLARMRAADERLRQEIPVAPDVAGDPLAQLILQGEVAAAAPTPRARLAAWRPLFALAAGFAALAFGFMLSSVSGDGSSTAEGFASGKLHAALEQARSGARLGDESGATAVVLTVNARDGRFCRLYRQRQGAGVTEGVACREADGWRVVAFDGSVDDAGFHTAGASPLIDQELDQLGGMTLEPAAENAALARQWTTR